MFNILIKYKHITDYKKLNHSNEKDTRQSKQCKTLRRFPWHLRGSLGPLRGSQWVLKGSPGNLRGSLLCPLGGPMGAKGGPWVLEGFPWVPLGVPLDNNGVTWAPKMICKVLTFIDSFVKKINGDVDNQSKTCTIFLSKKRVKGHLNFSKKSSILVGDGFPQ